MSASPRRLRSISLTPTHSRTDLSAGEREKLETTLGPEYSKRIVRAENLALEYVEIRLPEMLPVYRQMMETVHWLDRSRVFKRSHHTRKDYESGCRLVAAPASEQPGTGHLVSAIGASPKAVENRCESARRRRAGDDRARRRAARRFRNNGDAIEHRHSAHGLRVARRRDRRAAGHQSARWRMRTGFRIC